jgi:hypothetical protein
VLERGFEQRRGQRLGDFLKSIKEMPEEQITAEIALRGTAKIY